MGQCADICGYGDKRGHQFGGLGREHREHLLLQAGVAQRHALEVFEIDRTVIGSERRR